MAVPATPRRDSPTNCLLTALMVGALLALIIAVAVTL